MVNIFSKTFVRISFESLMTELKGALVKEGFVISGILDFQQDLQDNLGGHVKKIPDPERPYSLPVSTDVDFRGS